MMRAILPGLLGTILLVQPGTLAFAQTPGQDARAFVQKAVQIEMAKDLADHSHWLYLEVDQKPEHPVRQWVADTANGSLKRILQIDGHRLSPAEQQQRINRFLSDPSAQAKQRKSGAHDDKEAAEMLKLLPKAFIWTRTGEKGNNVVLHFRPDPNFNPPDLESKVFAAMEGDMSVDKRQMRIASLKGKMIRDVTIFGGVLGRLNAGGTFDVERRETGGGVWQITETHVHINGHALLFKTISEQEDDVKWDFKQLAPGVTMEQAKSELLQAHDGDRQEASK
jgi:hypothetical protein